MASSAATFSALIDGGSLLLPELHEALGVLQEARGSIPSYEEVFMTEELWVLTVDERIAFSEEEKSGLFVFEFGISF